MSATELEELYWLVRDLSTSLEGYRNKGVFGAPGGALAAADRQPDEVGESGGRPDAGGAASAGASAAAAGARESLAQVRASLGECQRCRLWEGRNSIVFGTGAEDADLMFIGEAPGAEEDRRAEPFVGRAGQLLDKMIAAMGWSREAVYIANVLKCRPPGNRDPRPDEVEQCKPFLARQIDAIQPRVLVTLGKPAAHLVLDSTAPISALRGSWFEYRGIPVMPTFHPAFLLRKPERKREAWSDLQQVMAELERREVRPR